MSFFREKQSRHFFYCMTALSTFLLIFGALFCIKQTQTAKEMLLSHDSAVISSLLQQGVSPDIIASAIANTKDNGQGKNLLMQIGYTEKTSTRFLPAVSNFEAHTFQYIFFGTLIFVGILLALCIDFLAKREQLYRQATKIIIEFSKGNFIVHLPRSEEGTIYQLFESVDNLASTLQAKGEIEYKARQFLKNSISDISHQLKTPLAALNMYNEIISDEPNNPVTITEFSQKTTVALNRIEQLIQSLLKITRLDVGSVTFEKDYYPISEIVAQATEELTSRAAREKKQIIVSGQSEEQISCDFQWTIEAVGNIVKNALDHTNSGGLIHIYWERSPAIDRKSVV